MIILSIDGGASRTRGVLFTDTGEVQLHLETDGSSLSRSDADAPRLLGRFIEELVGRAGLGLKGVGLVNVGVAGVSNQEAHERLFRELDRLGLSDRALVTSDVEAAYETVWGDGSGVLVCVGTGAIGWARDEQGNTYRASGRGPRLGGDPGSGYWLGKTAMVHLIVSEGALVDDEKVLDEDLDALGRKVMAAYGVESLEEAARLAGESADMVTTTARLGKVICELTEAGNDVALAILQEGTQGLAEDLLQMIDAAGLRREQMTIGMNGGIILNSAVYRRVLAEALSYDLPGITWRPPAIDPVFGAGLIAARLNQVAVDLDALKKSWRGYHLRSAG